MISTGSNIQSSDELKKIKIEYLYHALINPKPGIVSMLQQLRIIQNIDSKQYGIQKRRLPYVVCSIFNPPYRRTENFAYTEYFIIDIDHISSKGINIIELRKKLESDERTLISFLSPSEDGLKIIYKFSNRCYDASLYSIFYKEFVNRITQQYGIEQVIDTRTSDPTRACFISIDSKAYYNPNAKTINIEEYVNSDIFTHNTIKKENIKSETNKTTNTSSEIKIVDPDKEILDKIKQKLNPGIKAIRNKPEPYVPEELKRSIEQIVLYVESNGLKLIKNESIQYGKKLGFRLNSKESEINIFFGKRGFTIVSVSRSGTSNELNEITTDLVKTYIYENLT